MYTDEDTSDIHYPEFHETTLEWIFRIVFIFCCVKTHVD